MPLTGITAVCKEMFRFRSQLQMVKSCFCLCLSSTLDFHILCFPFCIWLFACCVCSPSVSRCAEVAFLPYRLLPELSLQRSMQCMATAAPGSQQVMQHCSHHQQRGQTGISLPEQGVLQGPVLATEALASHCAVSSSPSVPILVGGDGKPWGLSRHRVRLTVGGVFLPQERRLRGFQNLLHL